MGRIAALITGNPVILLWLALVAFAAGCAFGGSAAWYIQGVRLEASEQRLVAFRQEQTRIFQEHETKAAETRIESGKAFAELKGKLSDEIESGKVFKRCVDAGKCGVRRPSCPGPTSIRLPTSTGTDGALSDPIFVGPESAEDPVVADCAMTTLQLNQLQTAVEAQPGY